MKVSEGKINQFQKFWLRLNPWAFYILGVALLIGTPIFTLLFYLSEPAGPTWAHLRETVLTGYVLNSLGLMSLVAVLVLLLGTSTAWWVSTCDFPGRRFFTWAHMLPLAMPTYIVAYTYSGMLSYTGSVQLFFRNVLEWELPQHYFNIMHLPGVAVVMALVLYPYVFLIARTAFLQQSATLLEASRLMGSSAWRSFLTVGLPMARPALVAGTSLALMEVLNDYGAVKFYGVSTFTTGIFRAWFSMGDLQASIYLAGLLMLFIFGLILLERYQRGAARYHTGGKGKYPPKRYRLVAVARWAVFAGCSLPLTLGFLVPFMQLLAWAVQTFEEVADTKFFYMVANSFGLAAISALFCIVLATLLVYAQRFNDHWPFRMASKFAVLGYAVPGAVIAVGIMMPALALDKSFTAWLEGLLGVPLGLLFSGSLVLLVFAYCVRYLAVAYKPIEAGFQQVGTQLDEASRVLGASPRKGLFQIALPLTVRALLAGGLLVFVDVLKELPLTLILRPFNFDTLATKAFEMASDEMLAHSASAALLIVFTGLLPIIGLSRLIDQTHE